MWSVIRAVTAISVNALFVAPSTADIAGFVSTSPISPTRVANMKAALVES